MSTVLDYCRDRGVNLSTKNTKSQLTTGILNMPKLLQEIPELKSIVQTIADSQQNVNDAEVHLVECQDKVVEAERNLEAKQQEANKQLDLFDKSLQDVVLPVTVITPNTINGTGTGPFRPVISPLYPPVQKAIEECAKAKEDLDKARADLAEAEAALDTASITLITQLKGVVLTMSVTII